MSARSSSGQLARNDDQEDTKCQPIRAGIDAGKRSHHCVVLAEHGNVPLSTKVDNDETALLELIGTVAGIDRRQLLRCAGRRT